MRLTKKHLKNNIQVLVKDIVCEIVKTEKVWDVLYIKKKKGHQRLSVLL